MQFQHVTYPFQEIRLIEILIRWAVDNSVRITSGQGIGSRTGHHHFLVPLAVVERLSQRLCESQRDKDRTTFTSRVGILAVYHLSSEIVIEQLSRV